MDIALNGKTELFGALREAERRIAFDAARQGLIKAGMQIIADSQRNLRANGSNTTGRLSQSGRVIDESNGKKYAPDSHTGAWAATQGSSDKEPSIKVGFMEGDANYAGAVEYGSKAHWTSASNFYTWVSKKFGVKNGSRECISLAHAVQWAIARKGGTPHPFFEPAVRKNQSRITSCITEAVQRTIRDKYGKQ